MEVLVLMIYGQSMLTQMTREANALFLEAQYLHTRTRTEDNFESRYTLGNHSERCRSVGAGGERIDLVVNREGKWRVQANAYMYTCRSQT